MHYNGTHIDHDAPASITTINRSISDFIWSNAPTREIDLAITWLEGISHDCQFKISRLRALKAGRESDKKHKAKRAAVTALFDDPDFLNIDLDNQIRIIQQRLGADCSWARAAAIRDMAVKKLRRIKREDRDTRIVRAHRAGDTAMKIAAQENLTRQQVYNILKRKEKTLL